jgi:hypothetical protein
MSKKSQSRSGYVWCEICQADVPGPFCLKHELDRTITLSRREARILYDLAMALEYEGAYTIGEQKEPIKELIADLGTGNCAIAKQVVADKGFQWQIIEPQT